MLALHPGALARVTDRVLRLRRARPAALTTERSCLFLLSGRALSACLPVCLSACVSGEDALRLRTRWLPPCLPPVDGLGRRPGRGAKRADNAPGCRVSRQLQQHQTAGRGRTAACGLLPRTRPSASSSSPSRCPEPGVKGGETLKERNGGRRLSTRLSLEPPSLALSQSPSPSTTTTSPSSFPSPSPPRPPPSPLPRPSLTAPAQTASVSISVSVCVSSPPPPSLSQRTATRP